MEFLMSNFLFKNNISDTDPDIYELINLEETRQKSKIILIPSESQSPIAVREVLGSVFQNIYAEGYPDDKTRFYSESQILDFDAMLADYRRYSDPRYYKGVEYADVAEALARRRCAELFSTSRVSANEIFVNVQPLSGGPANNAIYHALVKPGDTVMGMNLIHGGHLSHGSPVNRSGKYYSIVTYGIDEDTGKINYDQIFQLAQESKPKFIIAGYTSYPWTVDWSKFKEIAESVNAYLVADIAHVAGLVAGGVYPNPIGYADVVSFTTHKSLCGPRGACILTTDPVLSKKIDRAVFPGEQGGPHVNVFASMAVAFKLAMTPIFKELQQQVVRNATSLSSALEKNGFRIPYGGTDTHLAFIDCGSVVGADGTKLSGDMAARILDIAGIVVNRNTIPGDTSALDPSGIRMGTPWVSQRGFTEKDMEAIAEFIAITLQSTYPYSMPGRSKEIRRAKVDFKTLENVKVSVRELINNVCTDYSIRGNNYPHFYFIDDRFEQDYISLEIGGDRVREFLNFTLSCEIGDLNPGESRPTKIFVNGVEILGNIKCVNINTYVLKVDHERLGEVASWLRDLSDGYIHFDTDILRKIPGPVWVNVSKSDVADTKIVSMPSLKPYYIGIKDIDKDPLPEFVFNPQNIPDRRTSIYDLHCQLGAKMIPFAGWEMPVWYTSVVEEHNAVRTKAGIFDVTHMGVYEIDGPDASLFLDFVVGNDVSGMEIGTASYTHFMYPTGDVIDDLLVYRLKSDNYMVVVNAANDDKDWSWLNSVCAGNVRISNQAPWSRLFAGNYSIRNLRDDQSGERMRVDIALQGPKSKEILLSLGSDEFTKRKIVTQQKNQIITGVLEGFDLIISRTGYTGEKISYELFVHPANASGLFSLLLEKGKPFGILPIGLGARDSLRTEAGLPLYGHELSGEHNLDAGDAGFGSYVKTYKPWFIGRDAFLERDAGRKGTIIRFRFNDKGVKVAHYSDPVLDKRGKVIGFVTSCAIDRFGYLTGQAYVELKSSGVDTQILIYQSAPIQQLDAPAELSIGKRTIVPTPATIIRRFPRL